MNKFYVLILALSLNVTSFAAETGPAACGKPGSESLDISQIGHDAFRNAPGLTEAQKLKLADLMKSTFAQAEKIKLGIANLKVDLFETLTDPSADNGKVNKIKDQIIELDKRRLALMFKSLDEVKALIGKNPETTKYLRQIMKEHSK